MVPLKLSAEPARLLARHFAAACYVDILNHSDKLVIFLDQRDHAAVHVAHLAQQQGKLFRLYTHTGPIAISELPTPPKPLWEQVPPKALARMQVLFGRYQGHAFDQTPVLYLDWLCSQDWFTGKARIYMELYLALAHVRFELERDLAEVAAHEDKGFAPSLDAVPQRDVRNPKPDPQWKLLRYLSADDMRAAHAAHAAAIAAENAAVQELTKRRTGKPKASRKRLADLLKISPMRITRRKQRELDQLAQRERAKYEAKLAYEQRCRDMTGNFGDGEGI